MRQAGVIFIPDGRFEFLLSPRERRYLLSLRERRYRGELSSPDILERVASAPINAKLAPKESARHYNGDDLKSLDDEEKTRVASADINAQLVTPNENDRHYSTDNPGLDLKLQEIINRVAQFQNPLPLFEGQPPYFRHGATVDIDSNARDVIPQLIIQYKLVPPNKIHLLVNIHSYGYSVSALQFKINFCNGNKAIRIEEYHPTKDDLDHNDIKANVKKTKFVNGQVFTWINGRWEVLEDYVDTKESYIKIEGSRENNDHSISWVCYKVGQRAKPLKTIDLMVSIRTPKESNTITHLTASFEAWLKPERNALGNIYGRIFGGEFGKWYRDKFPVHFTDPDSDY